MTVQSDTQQLVSTLRAEASASVSSALIRLRPVRKAVLRHADHRAASCTNTVDKMSGRTALSQIEQDRADMGCAILHSVDRAISSGAVKPGNTKKLVRVLMNAFYRREHHASLEAFREAHGYGPPILALLSPGKRCNLRCKGCYACSGEDTEQLDWHTLDRIIAEMKSEWGAGFVVISGGEPMAYESEGLGVLDAAAKHQDMLFMMYTNGTLIDKAAATRMAELGNITPAISLEGWREQTDARRGEGVYDKALEAMANLRQAGVPFGISLTATSENYRTLLSDEYLDHFFIDQGATYGWLFQYMPIGRGVTLDRMPTPEQRVWMRERTWQVIREKRYFVPDFWNSGTASFGCISAGREGGYLYIDWDGKVMPCAFVPHSPVNINEVYANGGTLSDVLDAPFFKGIRDWQNDYGFNAEDPSAGGNWTRPCIIRDHHREYMRILEETEPDPENHSALRAFGDEAYHEGLERYDDELAALLDPVWEHEYLTSND